MTPRGTRGGARRSEAAGGECKEGEGGEEVALEGDEDVPVAELVEVVMLGVRAKVDGHNPIHKALYTNVPAVCVRSSLE